MWWWQSVALGGAFSLGGSVPVEYFTCWASALVEEVSTHTAAAPAAALSTCRRVHRVISISSSLKVEHALLLWESTHDYRGHRTAINLPHVLLSLRIENSMRSGPTQRNLCAVWVKGGHGINPPYVSCTQDGCRSCCAAKDFPPGASSCREQLKQRA